MEADAINPDPTNPDSLTANPALADLPARDTLAVDGRGAPEHPSFGAAVRALFAVRSALGAGEDVPLEGIYSQGGSLDFDDAPPFDLTNPDGWHWRLLVPAPPGVTDGAVTAAAASLGAPVQRRRQPERSGPGCCISGPTPMRSHRSPLCTRSSPAQAELRTVLQVPVVPPGMQS
jgi:hypothetical protein